MKRKISIARSILKSQGIIGVLIAILKKMDSKPESNGKDISPIYTKARYDDILGFQGSPLNKLQKVDIKSRNGRHPKIAWIMPPPGKGSGGHLNIFRFIEYAERAGYTCSIYIYVDSKPISIEAIRLTMGDSYPPVKALQDMHWLDSGVDFDNSVGAIVSTSWETAYASYNLNSKARRLYFVQDFEPYFYPVGGMYTLAENTYKMGFYGITAGDWLKNKLSEEYGMQTESFGFGSDPKTYRFSNAGKRKEIFYYARPYTERRGFEVGILALDIFHKMHPSYTINLVGWDVSNYQIPFPYKNLKVLEASELSALYNRCVAGLVLSYTNMSLLPLELLACGTIPVVNDAPNNRLVSNNKYIAYAENNPQSIAKKLSDAVTRKEAASYAKKASESTQKDSWDTQGRKFISILEKVVG